MQQNNRFGGVTVRTAAQDFAGLVLGAVATATVVAGAAMGLVLLLAQ